MNDYNFVVVINLNVFFNYINVFILLYLCLCLKCKFSANMLNIRVHVFVL